MVQWYILDPGLHYCHCTNQIKVRKKCRRPNGQGNLEELSWKISGSQMSIVTNLEHTSVVIIYKWLAVLNAKIPRKRRCCYDYPIYDRWCYNSAGERVVSFNKYCLIMQTYTWEKKRSPTCMSHKLQKLIQKDLKTKGKK